ncbi:hypothetical protein [Pseudobutyrivibrio sp.]|uniref:hypothetical protein n=1 Tax=Pseudobutyrivibrio sp. TaxID=2014367 RepID=UPI001E06DDB0|nr:hypothetical protein [Pseudobutyrivibrio sp.]MBE5912022.1 hypothetical protein [Pseudobutyrivibrio sp.]
MNDTNELLISTIVKILGCTDARAGSILKILNGIIPDIHEICCFGDESKKDLIVRDLEGVSYHVILNSQLIIDAIKNLDNGKYVYTVFQ